MRTENITYFTETEEEFADLLIKIGIRPNIAKVLVYLANIPEAPTRAIERGTGLRQAEVSLAMQYLDGLHWISCREQKTLNKGRPMKVYELAKPIPEIMDTIMNEKKKMACDQLARVKKIRSYIN
ncbi:MAG: ArsR family transcriptional regulator [Methanoregula sp.]|jgi:predicted transcriptional regulator|nr:ArsR family transcriptional regulator [Methanoregula sp.]